MSDTPRTDELVNKHGHQRVLPNDQNASGWSSLDTFAFIDWAKQLERENNQLREALKQCENKLAIIEHATNDAFGSGQGAYHENALQAACEAITIVQNALKEK